MALQRDLYLTLAARNVGAQVSRWAVSDSCGTVHANSPRDVPARFDALGALAGMPHDAVQRQLAPALQAVVHVARVGGRRRVASVSVLRWAAGTVVCEPALDTVTRVEGPGWAALQRLLGSAA